jgi:hypothetical protein
LALPSIQDKKELIKIPVAAKWEVGLGSLDLRANVLVLAFLSLYIPI